MMDDSYYMKMALSEAREAAEEGEIPIGAVVVAGGRVIARAHNETERLKDVTAHAEILALTAAMNSLGAKYLPDCSLYVTVEPCIMCAGALRWSQIGRVVYGAGDEKMGYRHFSEDVMHPKTEVTGGVMAEECASLMKEFFRTRR